MPILRARNVVLRPVEESDLELLKNWRNSSDYMATCTTNANTVDVAEMRRLVKSRPFQFIIAHTDKGSVGTIYANKPNLTNGHLYITTFLDPSFRSFGYGPIALLLAIRHSFEKYSLRKIYFDVYATNKNSRGSFEGGLKHLGFEREGVFRDHRFQGGVYLDLIRFSIFKESKTQIATFLDRLDRLDKSGLES